MAEQQIVESNDWTEIVERQQACGELAPFEPLPPQSGRIRLRDYQQEAVDAIFDKLKKHRSTLLVLPTGMGKTVIFAEIAARWPDSMGRIAICAHRKELVHQAAGTVGTHLDEDCAIEMAERREASSPLWPSKAMIASVQTLSRPHRAARFDPNQFGLVIIDEGHHATAATYRRIIGHFFNNPRCRLLGVTATPDRADKTELGQIFESVAYECQINDGIDAGWLVPIHQKYIYIESLDFADVRTTGGDLNQGQLERVMLGADKLGLDEEEARKKTEAMLHAVADPTIREANGRQGIVFCVTKDHAEKMAEVFRRYGVHAETVVDETPDDVRAERIAAFRSGKLQFMIGVGVFTEGFDAPSAAIIAVARPTKSRALYAQMIGRATRPILDTIAGKETPEERKAAIAASSKPHALVLDFVGNSGKHKLISTADVLGDAHPGELRDHVVAKMIELGRSCDIRQAIDEELQRRAAVRKAMAELRKKQQEEREKRQREQDEERSRRQLGEERLRRLRARARYRSTDVSPFGHDAQHYQKPVRPHLGGATEKQIQFLVRLGVSYDTACGYGKKQAGRVIDRLTRREGGDWILPFGKYSGKTLEWVRKHDLGYLRWMRDNVEHNGFRRALELYREQIKKGERV